MRKYGKQHIPVQLPVIAGMKEMHENCGRKIAVKYTSNIKSRTCDVARVVVPRRGELLGRKVTPTFEIDDVWHFRIIHSYV